MDGSSWIASLPENLAGEQDKYYDCIVKGFEEGLININWVPITSTIPGHTATFNVGEDAAYVIVSDDVEFNNPLNNKEKLILKSGSRFRFQVSAKIAQKCADLVGGSLPTSKIMDLSYLQSVVKVDATILPASPLMSTNGYSKLWNKKLEEKRNAEIQKTGKDGLFYDCGKGWILSNILSRSKTQACNYGFFSKSAPYTNILGLKLWQNKGSRHNLVHLDASQSLIIMESVCEVDGKSASMSDIMKDTNLCKLVSDEGVIAITKQWI